jgi:glycosyltransferase involved in cell wall biosynthesis
MQNFEWKMFVRVSKTVNVNIVLDVKSIEAFNKAGLKNVKLIPNPISQYLQEVAGKIDFRSHKNLNNCIVYAGHIIPSKGIRELIQAFCLLKEELNLIMIGPVSLIFKQEFNLLQQWFYHNCRYSVQDQLSLPYLLLKNKEIYKIGLLEKKITKINKYVLYHRGHK